MSTPFLAELRVFSFTFAPKGWAMCNGQLLPINQNQALFSLLGTTYGGNGQTNFALPNLQSRVAVSPGNGINQGQLGGEESHTLITSEIPAHNHFVNASSAIGNSTTPIGNYPAATTDNPYTLSASGSPISMLNTNPIGSTLGHENRQPYLVLNVCIALQGIFPSRN